MIIIPHFDQYLGMWALQESTAQAHYAWFMQTDLHVHVNSEQAAAARDQAASGTTLDVRDGVAVIGIYGTLMKQVSSMSGGTSTVQARRQIRAAVADPNIKSILLHIDSPGGTVAGTQELADDIAAAKLKKPVYAYIQDLGASAAYWIASQATKVFANPTAMVGSIGTYSVAYDLSGVAEKEKVKVHVIRAGEMKGAGTPGTEITPAMLADWQTRVDALNEFFVRGVAAGRGLSLDAVRAMADGRVHLSAEAKALGMIDGVQSLDATFSALVALSKGAASMRAEITNTDSALMTDAAASGSASPAAGSSPIIPAAPAAARSATLAELKAACPGASNDFLVSQLEAGATVAQAGAAYMAKLTADNQQLAAKNKELEQATASTAVTPKKPGAPSIPAAESPKAGGGGESGDAISQFNDLVQLEMKSSNCAEHVAHAKVCRKNPELRQAMVAAHNAQHARRR